jgi:hypothetical protein
MVVLVVAVLVTGRLQLERVLLDKETLVVLVNTAVDLVIGVEAAAVLVELALLQVEQTATEVLVQHHLFQAHL